MVHNQCFTNYAVAKLDYSPVCFTFIRLQFTACKTIQNQICF